MAEVKYNEGVELTPQLTIKVLRLLGIRAMHYDPKTNHFKLTYHHFDDKLEWEVREVDVYLHMQEPVLIRRSVVSYWISHGSKNKRCLSHAISTSARKMRRLIIVTHFVQS